MTHSSNHYSYSGQDLFIGVDVHKRTYSVAVVLEGELLKKWRTPAVPEQLASQLKRYFPGANLKTVYEAGFSGFVLHRELESAGIESIVVNASSIETTVHNRVKTDKRDAFKLATQLAAGRLKGIRVPSREQEAKRLVTRTRQQLVEERTAVKNKLRMKCHQWRLLDATDQRRMSQRLMKEMLERSPSDEFRLVMEAYWQVWQTLEEQIKKLDKELERYRQLK